MNQGTHKMSHVTCVLACPLDNSVSIHPLLNNDPYIWLMNELSDPIDTLDAVKQLKPQVLVLHSGLTREPLDQFIELLLDKSPGTRVLLLVDQLEDERILKALSGGARGYIVEDDIPIFLNKAVHAINLGEAWVPRRMVGHILDHVMFLEKQISHSGHNSSSAS